MSKFTCLSTLSTIAVSILIGLSYLVFQYDSVDTAIVQTPLPTPSRTQNNNEMLPTVTELMLVDDDCTLPCYWGLIPGESTSVDVENLISSIDQNNIITDQVDDEPGYNFGLFFEADGLLITSFSMQDGILNRIIVSITEPRSWLSNTMFELDVLLESLDAPSEVFFALADLPFRYTLVLIYEERGVMIRYTVEFPPEPYDESEPLALCTDLDFTRQIDVWLQSPDNDISLAEYVPGIREENRDYRPFWSLERMTGSSIASFVTEIIDSPDNCLEAFSISELRDIGYNF